MRDCLPGQSNGAFYALGEEEMLPDQNSRKSVAYLVEQAASRELEAAKYAQDFRLERIVRAYQMVSAAYAFVLDPEDAEGHTAMSLVENAMATHIEHPLGTDDIDILYILDVAVDVLASSSHPMADQIREEFSKFAHCDKKARKESINVLWMDWQRDVRIDKQARRHNERLSMVDDLGARKCD